MGRRRREREREREREERGRSEKERGVREREARERRGREREEGMFVIRPPAKHSARADAVTHFQLIQHACASVNPCANNIAEKRLRRKQCLFSVGNQNQA